jgi:hypothetical protein
MRVLDVATGSRYGSGSPPELQELARDQVTDLTHLVRLEGQGGAKPAKKFIANGETAGFFLATGETDQICIATSGFKRFKHEAGITPRPIKLPM